MNYGDVLTRAWHIIWKHKILWIFGILAGCVEGGGGGGGGSGPSSGGQEINLPFEKYIFAGEDFFQRVVNNPEQYYGTIALIVLIFCVLWLAALALATIGRIGLIRGALKADQNEELIYFGDLWHDGTHHFWKVLGLWLILWLTSFFVLIMFGLLFGLAAVTTIGLGAILCLLPFFCLLVPISILVNLLFEQATIAMIKEEHGIIESLQHAWEVIRANLGSYFVMVVLLFILQLVVGFIVALPLGLMVIPLLFSNLFANSSETAAPLLIFVLCFVVYMPVLIVLNGIVRAYTWTAWTLTFTRLTAPPPRPARPGILDAA